MTGRWEHFGHGSDIGVRGVGPTPAAAFEQAGVALTAVCTDPALVRCTTEVPVACDAGDLELLLVAWLDAVIFEMAVRRMLFGRFEVVIDTDGRHLGARAFGETVDAGRHVPAVEVKGATLSAVLVAEKDGVWIAQCVVDV